MLSPNGKAYVQLAYTVTRRHGVTSYRAQALVGNAGCKGYHTRRLGIGDNRQQAEWEALEYVRQDYLKLGINPPASVINHGRKHGSEIDHCTFWQNDAGQ